MSTRYVWERYSRATKYNSSLSWSSADEYSDWLPTDAANPPDQGAPFWRVANNYSVDPDTGIVTYTDLYENDGAYNDYDKYVGGDVADYQFLFLADTGASGAGAREVYRVTTDSSTPTWDQNSRYIVSISLSYLVDRVRRGTVTSYYAQGSTNYGPIASANSGAYPQNSYSGSYWYVYQGADSIDPAAVTLPAGIFGGDTVTVTVTPSAGKVYGGNVTYTWQYRLDGGAWQSLGSGAGTTQSLTVPAGTGTVEVQVRAADDLGFTSSTWVSSGAVSVTNNLAPTAPGSIAVSSVVAGEPVTVTLTAATDPDGTVSAYLIERRVDGGGWQPVTSGPGLTYTDTADADWQSVQYRAAAVDNEGAQGPYIESEVLSVSTGAVTITGPASGQGEHAQPFDVGPLTLGVTPAPSDPAVQFAVLLDGAEAVSASHQSGDQITLHIDPRVMARGAHTITVTASKEAYAQAMAQYTYTVPAWDGSDIEGGLSAPFQDWLGRKLLPRTLAQDCLGPDGKDVATWIAELQQALGSLDPIPLEPVIRQAPPAGSFALAPGTLYDFTQADASALTFTFTAPADGKAAAYHVMFKCGSTAAAVTLPAGVKTPDGYVIEAGRVYELSILEGLLTYQSWEADA